MLVGVLQGQLALADPAQPDHRLGDHSGAGVQRRLQMLQLLCAADEHPRGAARQSGQPGRRHFHRADGRPRLGGRRGDRGPVAGDEHSGGEVTGHGDRPLSTGCGTIWAAYRTAGGLPDDNFQRICP
ncbi:hypothetical protein [Streptosporangium sandarakinum]|uniref:hypothetical protein n=1 Tax=Streptosporangium sandarakinum TaxID=1260955 RepID=UPI00339E8658